jgi:hypothetical protein
MPTIADVPGDALAELSGLEGVELDRCPEAGGTTLLCSGGATEGAAWQATTTSTSTLPILRFKVMRARDVGDEADPAFPVLAGVTQRASGHVLRQRALRASAYALAMRFIAAPVGRILAPFHRGRELSRGRRLARAFLGVMTVLSLAWFGTGGVREMRETIRTTSRYDPPVWAGQNVPGACSGGFYARHEQTIVLTIVGHCATPGATLRDASGRVIGVFGPLAQLADCPAGRFCSPSDFLTLALAPDRIPWGHLNMVDMGAGGYRILAAGTRPLSCADMAVGDAVEVDGREHFRSGNVIAIGRYEHPTDLIFPCIVTTDVAVAVGDSGGAVLDNGRPAGITSRSIAGHLAFTPLAEGLENLGLVLCTTPDCDLTPGAGAAP